MQQQLIRAMMKAIQDIKQWPGKQVQIFHHNDSDGLTSGAILTRAFTRQRYEVKRYCLEKPYPAVLKKIFEQEGNLIVFADFTGRIAPMLSALNQKKNLIVILDHHVAEATSDPLVHNLDPELYGLKGDRDISASTTCYLFARCLNPINRDMAHMAAIGAVGDGFFVAGRLASQNRHVLMEAVQQGLIEIRGSDEQEQYFLTSGNREISCEKLSAYLDLLGAAGYYRNGPDMGIRVCLEGVSPESDQMVDALKAIKMRAFESEINRLREGGLKTTSHIQWFQVDNRFSPMGVKMIGLFCQWIRDRIEIDPQKYIAGFQIIPDEIPGFGLIQMNAVKISMRVSTRLEEKIRKGESMGLDRFLPEATNNLGGFSDACHRLAAATTVSVGQESELIEEMEGILSR